MPGLTARAHLVVHPLVTSDGPQLRSGPKAAAAKEPAAEMTLSRRDLLMGAGAMAGTAAVLAACGPPPPPPPILDPNAPRTIVVIIADDMRFDYRGLPTALD